MPKYIVVKLDKGFSVFKFYNEHYVEIGEYSWKTLEWAHAEIHARIEKDNETSI